MALKFKIQASKEDLTAAKAESGSRYSGPTPPPDVYNVKLIKLFSSEDRNGNPRLVATLQIEETGDKAVYNGARIFDNLAIPADPGYEHFAIQVNVLNSFLVAASGGSYTIDDFVKDANAGKIATDGETQNGDPIVKSIGKFHVEKAKDIKVKTKLRSWNGTEYVNVHYYITDGITVGGSSDEGDASADDIADLLG
jgi:hypothetical protein